MLEKNKYCSAARKAHGGHMTKAQWDGVQEKFRNRFVPDGVHRELYDAYRDQPSASTPFTNCLLTTISDVVKSYSASGFSNLEHLTLTVSSRCHLL